MCVHHMFQKRRMESGNVRNPCLLLLPMSGPFSFVPENSDDADISRRNNICGIDAAFKGCFQMALSMLSGGAFRWVVDAYFPMVLWMLWSISECCHQELVVGGRCLGAFESIEKAITPGPISLNPSTVPQETTDRKSNKEQSANANPKHSISTEQRIEEEKKKKMLVAVDHAIAERGRRRKTEGGKFIEETFEA